MLDKAAEQQQSKLVPPHGSDTLMPLLAEGEEKARLLEKAKSLPQLKLSSREVGDLIMLGIGGFTPLTGFMGSKDWKGVVTEMKLESGIFWPIPITLSAVQADADALEIGQEVALVSPDQEIMGILTLEEKYQIDIYLHNV